MKQLVLDIRPDAPPTLENFVAGANAELVATVSLLASPATAAQLPARHIYLWGAPGSGRSHLLEATALLAAARRPVCHLPAAAIGAELAVAPGSLLVIDDVAELGTEAQVALFRTFNAARIAGLAFLIAGPAPVLRLDLREDLRTRIGQCLIYEVKPLSDDEKAAALRRHALLRGMQVDDGLLAYLLRHGRRDLPSLMGVLDALDQATLRQKRPATLPLLKEVLQLPLE